MICIQPFTYYDILCIHICAQQLLYPPAVGCGPTIRCLNMRRQQQTATVSIDLLGMAQHVQPLRQPTVKCTSNEDCMRKRIQTQPQLPQLFSGDGER